MNTLKAFFKATFIGGALIVLPIVILIFVFNWLYEFIEDKLRPITNIILETAKMQEFAAAVLALVIILLIFFIVGLVIQTKIGIIIFNAIEQNFLTKIPLYKIIKETTIQLMGNNRNLFKHVAVVKLFDSDTRITAFVTETHDNGSYTVFVPSGPAPTAGFIYHLKKENVQIVKYPIEKALKTIFSLGAGSNEIIKIADSANKTEN